MPSQRSIRNPDPAPVLRREGALRYLEPLLRQPGRSFHVAELIRVAACPPPPQVTVEDAEAVERARKAVTNRIRQTVVRIAGVHNTLGFHLRNAVHTGTRCTYTPERPIRWSE